MVWSFHIFQRIDVQSEQFTANLLKKNCKLHSLKIQEMIDNCLFMSHKYLSEWVGRAVVNVEHK